MNSLKTFLFLFLVFFLIEQCSRDKATIAGFESQTSSDTSIVVRKPNIYIYPEEKIDLKIEVSFPFGGKIITSEPAYTSLGWDITVDTSGLINNAYQYLFYECEIPNHFQTKNGWKVPQKNLNNFLHESLIKFGLNEMEIYDFVEYWVPKLNDFEYYLIFPQKKEIINQMIHLNFSKEPKKLQRMFYLFKGINKNYDAKINPPQYSLVNRNGYTIIEWGGMISK